MPSDSGPRVNRRVVITVLLVEVLLCTAVLVAVARGRDHHPSSAAVQRESGLPANISSSVADEMGLGPISGLSERNFALVDQHDRPISLHSLEGHVVVLQFMDSACSGVCPVASAETRDAYRDLGANQPSVDFVTVNVDRFHDSVADAAAMTQREGLAAVSTWHFLTGPPGTLASTWHKYNVEVRDATASSPLTYLSQFYFIGPTGNVRFVAITTSSDSSGHVTQSATTEAAVGQGIATIALDIAGVS